MYKWNQNWKPMRVWQSSYCNCVCREAMKCDFFYIFFLFLSLFYFSFLAPPLSIFEINLFSSQYPRTLLLLMCWYHLRNISTSFSFFHHNKCGQWWDEFQTNFSIESITIFFIVVRGSMFGQVVLCRNTTPTPSIEREKYASSRQRFIVFQRQVCNINACTIIHMLGMLAISPTIESMLLLAMLAIYFIVFRFLADELTQQYGLRCHGNICLYKHKLFTICG